MTTCPVELVDESSPSLTEHVIGRPIEEAVPLLHAADVDSGFVQEDPMSFDYYLVPGRGGRPPLLLQFNPRRSQRQAQTGRGECVLCLATVKKRLQRYVSFRVIGRRFVALANPWPYMPGHVTIASASHDPQSWRTPDRAEIQIRLTQLVRLLLSLARGLPGRIVIYNGEGAGATIPGHFHVQAFSLFPGHGPLPIEVAARRAVSTPWPGIATAASAHCFPLRFFVSVDRSGETVETLASLLERWDSIEGGSASVNLIAIAQKDGTVTVYVVPRHMLFRKAMGFSSVFGSLEACGVFVVSSDEQRQAMSEGRVTHDSLWQALQAVQPPRVSQLLD